MVQRSDRYRTHIMKKNRKTVIPDTHAAVESDMYNPPYLVPFVVFVVFVMFEMFTIVVQAVTGTAVDVGPVVQVFILHGVRTDEFKPLLPRMILCIDVTAPFPENGMCNSCSVRAVRSWVVAFCRTSHWMRFGGVGRRR